MLIFKVTMISGDTWEGCASDFGKAANNATIAFLAPLSAVKKVELKRNVKC